MEKIVGEREVLVASFLGLALWAYQCPCDIIFRCHKAEVITVLAGLFAWIFMRTTGEKKNNNNNTQ